MASVERVPVKIQGIVVGSAIIRPDDGSMILTVVPGSEIGRALIDQVRNGGVEALSIFPFVSSHLSENVIDIQRNRFRQHRHCKNPDACRGPDDIS